MVIGAEFRQIDLHKKLHRGWEMKLNRVCICLLVIAAVSTSALAAGNSGSRTSLRFGAVGARVQADEAADYKAWYDANDAKDYAKAYGLAKAFVAKYPSSANNEYLKKWIPATRGLLFNTVWTAKDVTKMLEYGNEALTEDPNNIDYLYLLSVAIYSYEISQKNFAHAKELIDFNQRLISLLDSGKVPAAFAKDTTFNKNTLIASLNQQIGVIALKDGDTTKAFGIFQKASSLNPKDPYNYLQIGLITYTTTYKAAADKYQALPKEDREAAEPKPEVKAALDEVNKQTDMVIDNWAHYVALEANPDSQVKSGLTELYKFRHPDMPDGLQKLIDQYKSGNGPVNPKP
jgi:tetratricopeptide (TPR) repeat protein